MSDKMREEFERTNGRDHRRQPPKGNNYIDPMAQADWESFQKGWKQSRETLVVNMSDLSNCFSPDGCGDWAMWLSDVNRLIEAAGVKVKP